MIQNQLGNVYTSGPFNIGNFSFDMFSVSSPAPYDLLRVKMAGRLSSSDNHGKSGLDEGETSPTD
jgi:hypothetical protein